MLESVTEESVMKESGTVFPVTEVWFLSGGIYNGGICKGG